MRTGYTRTDRQASYGPQGFGDSRVPTELVSNQLSKVLWNPYIFRLGIALQVRLDGLVLLVELGQIRNEILDNVGVWQRVDARRLRTFGRNTAYPYPLTHCRDIHLLEAAPTQTSKGIDTINVHRTATADTLSAAPSEGQGGVDFVFDSNERIQHHRASLVQVQFVRLHLRLLGGAVRVPAVDLELLVLGRGLLQPRDQRPIKNNAVAGVLTLAPAPTVA